MMSLIRKLTGHCRREAEADQVMCRHREAAAPKLREVRKNIIALEELMRRLQKDIDTWRS